MGDADHIRASRTRIAESAAATRREHERALHDGVQQDLIAMAVRLQLVRDLVAHDAPAALALLEELRDDVHDALDRVRGVADDIYPSVLGVRGLPDALGQAVRRAGAQAAVVAEGVGRYPEALEAAVYFCCSALLTEGATAIALSDDGENLRLELEGLAANDDARDLAEAAGGTLTAGSGRIIATFPRGTGSPP
jgi:signal transduction histidine kinase